MVKITDFVDDFKIQCQEDGIDYLIAYQIAQEYFPILIKSYEILGKELFKTLFWYEKEGDDIRMKNWKNINTIFNKIIKQDKLNKEEKLIINLHITYLTFIEGIFAPNLNYLVWHTINNGYDFTLYKRKIINYEEVIECTLGQKINFLKKNKKFNIITENVDVNLRNSVSHLYYEIEDDKLKIDDNLIDFYKQIKCLSSILKGMVFTQEIFDKYILK
jgi:hypothetical protein